MSRALPSYNRRRVLIAGVVGGVMVSGVVVVGAAMAGQTKATTKATTTAAPTVNCPAVKGALPAIPARAQAEVTRNLALLDTQIAEANRRLITSQGEGGPNFINNAILGPLKSKRVATIDRIAISIGRHAARPTGLESLAACSLNTTGATATATATATPTVVASATAPATPTATATPTGTAAAGSTIVCPNVAALISNVPASAQAGVAKELALLQKQINEANTRLVNSVGQGGPNFVNNAILGPLKDKRVAVIDRIVLDFTRTGAAAPNGVNSSLAACALS